MKSARRPVPVSVRPTDPEYQRERYTVADACAYLCLHHKTLRQEVRARRIGFRQDGRHAAIWFAQADLDLWRQARRQEATDRASRALRPTTPPTPLRPTMPVLSEKRFG